MFVINQLRSEKGTADMFALLCTCSLFSLSMGLLSAARTQSLTLMKYSAVDNTKLTAEILVDRTNSIISNPNAISAMRDLSLSQNNASTLSCSVNETSCDSKLGQKHLIQYVYQGNGQLWLDLSQATTGFDESGEACQTYGIGEFLNDGSRNPCVFRVEVYWEPSCIGLAASCSDVIDNYSVKIMKKSYGYTAGNQINWANHQFEAAFSL